MFENVFAVPYCFIKVLYLEQNYGILHSPWCNNSCQSYHELKQSDFYSFDHGHEKVLFLSNIWYLPKRKIYLKKNHAYLIQNYPYVYLWNNLSHTICHGMDIYMLNICPVLVNISSKVSIKEHNKIPTFFIDENYSR